MNPEQNRQRGERKFVLSGVTFEELLSLVHLHPSGFLRHHPTRQVNNTYFDSSQWDNYLDNIEGVSERCKVRLRWYGPLEGNISASLQFKIKKGFEGFKKDYAIENFEMSGNILWPRVSGLIRNSLPEQALNMFNFYPWPTVTNCYQRNYFISSDGKFRLTIDRDIKYFNQIRSPYPNLANPEIVTDEMVLEIKYPIGLDDVAGHVTSWFPFRVSKNSKYINGVNLMLNDA